MSSFHSPYLRRCLPIHSGKYSFELNQTPANLFSDDVLVTIFPISREAVEQGDVSRFLSAFGIHNSVEHLRGLQGKTLFLIKGYDDHPDPLFTIPEVRSFFAKCHKSWPCWSFFAELETNCLTVVLCCLTPNLASIRQDQVVVEVALPEKDVNSFFIDGLATSAYLHHKVGTDQLAGAKLLQQTADYLHISES